jgi:tetratricopeptide (TPR) repeat protein
MNFAEIDKTYEYYERRYNLSKMASDCGISSKIFNNLNSKEKFLVLSNKLKETNKINLAYFFYGKLFEVSQEMQALLNKIDCLIKLGEYEEASRFNNIGWELFLEDPEVDPFETEKKLTFQKALIAFYLDKFHTAESLCEEAILKFKAEEFYYLLCAIFIALNDNKCAIRLYNKYCNKFGSSANFLLEIFVLLLDINYLEKAIDFADFLFNISDKQKKSIINQINKYYNFNKNKSVLKKYFDKEINSLSK